MGGNGKAFNRDWKEQKEFLQVYEIEEQDLNRKKWVQVLSNVWSRNIGKGAHLLAGANEKDRTECCQGCRAISTGSGADGAGRPQESISSCKHVSN